MRLPTIRVRVQAVIYVNRNDLASFAFVRVRECVQENCGIDAAAECDQPTCNRLRLGQGREAFKQLF